MHTPEVRCPVRPAQSERQTDESESITHAGLLEKTSQKILDEPESTRAHLDELETELRIIYAEMLLHQPAKAELAIVRKLRAVVRGPLGILVYNQLLARLGDYSDDELARKTRTNYPPFDFSDLYINADYRNSTDSWMQIMHETADDAILAVLYDDPYSSHVFECMNEQSHYLWPRLDKAHKDAGSNTPVDWSLRDLAFDLTRSTTENITVALDTIRAGHLAISHALGDDTPSEDGIAEILYNNIEELSWIASTNRPTIAKILPAANGHTRPVVVGLGGKDDIDRLQKVFRFENGTLTPRHPSLRNSEWRWPGNCAGRWKHTFHKEQQTLKTKGFYSRIGHPELSPGNDGDFHAIKAVIAAGIEVGRHTILTGRESI